MEELNYLWQEKRPQVVRKVAEAAAMGDRSENAEYIYGKRQLREIDRRIRFLSKRLDDLVVVDRLPADKERVYFGAWVTLTNEQGVEVRYRIVGSDEFDRATNYISIDAPMARSLLKKTLDDEVSVQLPEGKASFIITNISYESSDGSDDNEGSDG